MDVVNFISVDVLHVTLNFPSLKLPECVKFGSIWKLALYKRKKNTNGKRRQLGLRR